MARHLSTIYLSECYRLRACFVSIESVAPVYWISSTGYAWTWICWETSCQSTSDIVGFGCLHITGSARDIAFVGCILAEGVRTLGAIVWLPIITLIGLAVYRTEFGDSVGDINTQKEEKYSKNDARWLGYNNHLLKFLLSNENTRRD